MKYLFDIGHPAEFHLFKHVIRILQQQDHEVVVTARDKDVTLDLLNKSGIPYFCTGKNLPSKPGKIFSLLRNEYRIFKAAKAFKPDIMINFFSPFAAHVGKLLGKPVIGFHDTESAGISAGLARPFTDVIVVPQCYRKKLPPGKKIVFNGVFELAYLHPKYFSPDPTVLDRLKVKENQPYVLIRLVSHHALHDTGYKGISPENKRKAVKAFSQHANVFISSEEKLPLDLQKYELKIPPGKMHDVLSYAALLYGESATMASEGAVLGIPAIFVHHKGCGYTHELEQKYGLVFNFSNSLVQQQRSIARAVELLKTRDTKKQWQEKRARLLAESIDLPAFMAWLIMEYPQSIEIIKKNPGYLLNFKPALLKFFSLKAKIIIAGEKQEKGTKKGQAESALHNSTFLKKNGNS
jgi:predicted glycosyltransferase